MNCLRVMNENNVDLLASMRGLCSEVTGLNRVILHVEKAVRNSQVSSYA